MMLTLTSQEIISDEEFKKRLASFLAWGRKYVPQWFNTYVWVLELQQRGVLHAHILLLIDKRIPNGLFRRMRNLWAETYGMGPGSFDMTKIHRASRAAAYLGKAVGYLSRKSAKYSGGRQIGRNGKPYVREEFAGNAYGMAANLRLYGKPVTELAIEWGHGIALDAVGLRGTVKFFGNVDAAHAWLSTSLSPPRVQGGIEA